eukprot:PhM_4_TR1243/c0_g1_i1/m.28284/K08371/CYB561D2; cytochrome b-561 domain containing protein 2
MNRFLLFIVCAVCTAPHVYFFVNTDEGVANLFQYHPLLVAATMNFLVPCTLHEATRARKERSKPLREAAVYLHTAIGGTAASLVLSAASVVYYNKDLWGKPHYASLHGQIGCAAATLSLVLMALGVMYKYRVPVPGVRQHRLRSMHKWTAYICLCVLYGAWVLGFESHFAQRTLPSDNVRYALAMTPFIGLVASFL